MLDEIFYCYFYFSCMFSGLVLLFYHIFSPEDSNHDCFSNPLVDPEKLSTIKSNKASIRSLHTKAFPKFTDKTFKGIYSFLWNFFGIYIYRQQLSSPSFC